MPAFARLRRRSLARRLVAAFAGVWLYAALSPCLMAAATHCPDCPPASSSALENEVFACAPAMDVDCALPDVNPVALDWSVDIQLPMAVLAIVPAGTAGPPTARFERHSENAALCAPPPLASRPAVLLM
jgi:hypothetical protein